MHHVRPFLFAFLSAFVAAAPCAPLPAGHDQLKEEPDTRALDPERGAFAIVRAPVRTTSAHDTAVPQPAVPPVAADAAALPAPAFVALVQRHGTDVRAAVRRADVVAGLCGLPPPGMPAAA